MNIDRSGIPAGSRVLCAVSGGADSMCLLHWLHTQPDLELTAAHFEHGIRGEESLRDAAFVEAFCQRLGILCVTEHADVPTYAREMGLGLEEAARELRYAFLERTADRLNCDYILTAHNADDNAETVLLNLCRGAGPAGLAGIPPERGRILRPLLGCTRAEIEAYLRENGVPHVEDSSNDSTDYSRNRIRHQVMPVLRDLNPRFSEAALRSSRLLRQDGDCLDRLASAFLREQGTENGLLLPALLELHPALASRVLRAFCGRNLEQTHVDAALRFCAGEGLGYLDLPGLRLRREQDRRPFPGVCFAPEIAFRFRKPGWRWRSKKRVFPVKFTACLTLTSLKVLASVVHLPARDVCPGIVTALRAGAAARACTICSGTPE